MVEVRLVGVSAAAATGQAVLVTRANQAIPYLLGAARYSRLVGQLETANANKAFGDFWEEMRDHAVSCVFFADAAIESYANELFADAPGRVYRRLGFAMGRIGATQKLLGQARLSAFA